MTSIGNRNFFGYITPMRAKEKAQKRIAVIGYGGQGRAISLNLRDSGWDVSIGLPAKSRSRARAKRDRFTQVGTVRQVAEQAEIICFAFPDHLHGKVFDQEIRPFLKSGATLWFLHGTSIQFGFVKPPKTCDVIMVAPHAPGTAVREKFLYDRSISAFWAVEQNRSGKAKQLAFALAEGCGFKKRNLVKTSFKDEAIGDLFGEQAVLCGGMAMLISAGYETLVKSGIKPEHAYLEVAYQLDLIISLIKKYGMQGMWERISVAARFGSLVTGPKLIDSTVKKKMRQTLDEISSGRFPEKLSSLTKQDIARLNKSLKRLTPPSFDRAATKQSRRSK